MEHLAGRDRGAVRQRHVAEARVLADQLRREERRAVRLPSTSTWYRKHFDKAVHIVLAPSLAHLKGAVRRSLIALYGAASGTSRRAIHAARARARYQ